ncbi:MAG: OmpA family protein, partial [Bacteroidota bacterium]
MIFRWIAFIVSWFLLISTGLSQGNIPIKTSSGVLKQKAVLLDVPDTSQYAGRFQSTGLVQFPNATRWRFYDDKKKLAKIKASEGMDDLYYQIELLEDYVTKFGIRNFRDNIQMVWKLARLKELAGDTAAAVFYYEQAIKHNRSQLVPRLAYDTLVAPTKSEWLPLDTYYKLLKVRKRMDPLIPENPVRQNMGTLINSSYADYAPMMNHSDSVLIFTSRRENQDLVDPFQQANEELYFSVKDFMDGGWQEAEKFDEAINSDVNEGSACLSPDGKTLYFTRCNSPDGMGDCDIFQATYDVGKWVAIKSLGPMVNSRSWDSQPNITADGNVLFFASNRFGGFGGVDLYYTQKLSDGTWSRAQNLGPVINTPRDEVTPFFHSINSTLYFGTTGQLMNYGDFDIMKSRWMENQWEEPNNLGPLINSATSEYYFSIDSKGANIFYASAKRGEGIHEDMDFDLFSFPMPMESRPDAVTKLQGILRDSVTGYALRGAVMVVDLDNGVEIAPKRINEKGYFEFDLKNNNRYRLYVIGDNF